jgi:hypothetical protein
LVTKTQAEARLTRYLLGECSEAEREQLEAEYFADEDVFAQMLTAEDDLIDAYARHQLSSEQRQKFEQHFRNSPQMRDRVQFARALVEPVNNIQEPPREVSKTSPSFFATIFARTGPWQVATAAVAIVVIIGFSWLLVERSRMNQQIRELQAQRERLSQRSDELQRAAEAERARSAELTAQLNAAAQGKSQPVRPPGIISNDALPGNAFGSGVVAEVRTPDFSLFPGSVRSGGGTTLRVPSQARSLRLHLMIENPSARQEYSAAIEKADGGSAWAANSFRRTDTKPGRITLPTIPVDRLPPGDYILSLKGKQADGTVETVGSYSFRIVKQ